MTTNPTPLTAEKTKALKYLEKVHLLDRYDCVESDTTANMLANDLVTYAAQQNAVAEGQVKATNLLLDRANTYIDKLEAENERLKQQLDWQAIETAPKDGTEFDIWSENIGFRKTGISWRTLNDDERPWRDSREAAFRDKDGYKVTFKHWMPQPQPPKEATL